MRSKTMLIVIGMVLGLLLAAAGIVVAGSLNPGSGPGDAGSQMFTLQQIYDRLDTGAAGDQDDGVHRASERAGEHHAHAG